MKVFEITVVAASIVGFCILMLRSGRGGDAGYSDSFLNLKIRNDSQKKVVFHIQAVDGPSLISSGTVQTVQARISVPGERCQMLISFKVGKILSTYQLFMLNPDGSRNKRSLTLDLSAGADELPKIEDIKGISEINLKKIKSPRSPRR